MFERNVEKCLRTEESTSILLLATRNGRLSGPTGIAAVRQAGKPDLLATRSMKGDPCKPGHVMSR
jgi:hypothetical protein